MSRIEDCAASATAAAAASSGSAGLALPSKNHELKRLEEEAMLGKDLLLRLHVPGKEAPLEMWVKESNEAGYIKYLLSEKIHVDTRRIRLFFNNRELLDPMSLCDHPGVSPPSVDIDVQL